MTHLTNSMLWSAAILLALLAPAAAPADLGGQLDAPSNGLLGLDAALPRNGAPGAGALADHPGLAYNLAPAHGLTGPAALAEVLAIDLALANSPGHDLHSPLPGQIGTGALLPLA